MADLDENLVSVLLADAGVAAITSVVSINEVPPNRTLPYIWLQLDDEVEDTDISGGGGIVQSIFDIECTSDEITEAKDLQAAVKAALHGVSGTFGDQTIAYAEITSKDDSYETRQPFDSENNLHVSALSLEIATDSRS